jgi:lipid A 3-O-deacylase
MRYVIGSLVCLSALGFAPPCVQAEGFVHEVKGGVLAHDVPDLWSGFRTEDDAVAVNIEALLSPSLNFLGGSIRPAIGGSIATEGGTSNAYVDARWEFETPCGIFFSIGLGGTIHNGETELKYSDQEAKALGSRVLFHIPAEIGYRFDQHSSLSVYFEHMSNANTADFNEGLDRLGVRYGYRF